MDYEKHNHSVIGLNGFVVEEGAGVAVAASI